MTHVYIIKSLQNDPYYTGMTDDVVLRLTQHNAGKSNYTKKYLPWVLVYSESCANKIEARVREKYLKTTNGKRSVLKENY